MEKNQIATATAIQTKPSSPALNATVLPLSASIKTSPAPARALHANNTNDPRREMLKVERLASWERGGKREMAGATCRGSSVPWMGRGASGAAPWALGASAAVTWCASGSMGGSMGTQSGVVPGAGSNQE